jgi:hypothetical protein
VEGGIFLTQRGRHRTGKRQRHRDRKGTQRGRKGGEYIRIDKEGTVGNEEGEIKREKDRDK